MRWLIEGLKRWFYGADYWEKIATQESERGDRLADENRSLFNRNQSLQRALDRKTLELREAQEKMNRIKVALTRRRRQR